MNTFPQIERIIYILTIISFAFRITAQQEERLHYPDRFFYTTDTIIDPFSLKKKAITKGEESKLDSVYEFDWSAANTEWIKTYGIFHNYNEDKVRINTIGKVWIANPGMWENNVLQEYHYDDNGNRNKEVIKAWSGSLQEWINYAQRLYYLNEYNNLTSYTEQVWNDPQQSWNNVKRFLYIYDESQHWIYYERQDWNQDSLRWEMNYRFSYIYENDLKTEMLRQNWNKLDSTWLNDTKNLYYYNGSGNLVEEIQFIWQTGSSSWVESTKITYIRDQSDQVIEKIYQVWITGVWKNTVRYTYQYELTGRESEYVYYTWNGEAWDENKRCLKDYDETGSLVRETDQQWQSGKGSWINDYKWEYHYTHFVEPLFAYISDSTNVSCYGYSDGTATVMITGGMPPYTILWNDPQSTTNHTVYGLSADQYYTVTVTDANLNSVSDSVMLSQPPEIITGSIYGEVNVNQNDTVTYWVESDTSSFYSWSVMHGEILSAQGGDTIVVVWTQPGQGKVSVFETTTNGCEGDTVSVSVSISPTSIEKPRFGDLKIYPNPASQWITVQLTTQEFNPWDLEILDMTGKTIRSFRSLTKNKFQVSLDNLSQGIYFFRITNSSGVEIRKVVVER